MAAFVRKVFSFAKGRDSSPQVEQAQKVEDASQRPYYPDEDPDLQFGMAPLCPPMPDLTGLSHEEIQIIKDVFRRQQQFDVETKERIKNIKIALGRYDALAAEFHQREQTGYIDLRLCQLCFRIKFADGIGRVCCDCEKRVCHRCGSFARPRWDPKRSKSIRGKWRCAQCQLRRELMCKTGTWYHGDGADDFLHSSDATAIQKLESDDTIVPAIDDAAPGRRSPPSPNLWRLHYSPQDNLSQRNYDTLTEVSSDVFRSGVDIECPPAPQPQSQNSVSRRSYRTRSLPAGYTDGRREEEEVSGDTEHFETERKLLRKKRLDRKLRRRSILRNRTSTDMPEIVVNPPDDTNYRSSKSRTLSGTALSHESRRKENVERRRKEAVAGLDIEKKSSGDQETDNQSKIQRQNAICYSSSSNSLTSESKPEHATVETGNVLEPEPFSSSKQQDIKNKYRSVSLTQTRVRTLDITPVFRSSTYDVPMMRGDGLLAPDTSPNKCRRITLPLCQDLGLVAQKAKGEQANLPPSNPHEIILHRNKEDGSYRSRGLGMRVIGGKLGDDKRLGAYVRSVESGGPADLQGNIREGDQILTWDGQSLVDVTYEEAQEIMDRSGNIVQILIWHRPITEEDTVAPTAAERREKFQKADSADVELTLTKDKEFENLGIKRKRRILPKTPLEIKKDTTRVIVGRLQMKIHFMPEKLKLAVTIVKVVDLVPADKPERKVPSPLAMLRLLPSGCWEQFETTTILNDSTPEWNESFTFAQLSPFHLKNTALEVTFWSYNKNAEETFLGEVLLDLIDAALDDQPIWYDLEDHDENSSPLPDRTKLYPENSPMSSTSTETSRTGTPCRGSSPSPFNRSPAGSFSQQRNISVTPTHDKRKHLLSKKSPAREKLEAPVGRASPVHSPVSSEDSYVQSSVHRNSLSKKMKRKMSQAVMKVSATLAVADCRESSGSLSNIKFGEPDIKIWGIEDLAQPVNRSVSAGNVHALDIKDLLLRPDAQNRKSAPQLGLLAPPLSQASSISSCFVDDTSEELLSSLSHHTTPDLMQHEKHREKPCLGPGQIQSVQPSDEDKGCLKLGFMVTKGQLEVDVLTAQGLSRPDKCTPQDTYVKTYVMQGNKVMQKKKTSINKDGADPNYREKIKYSACNALGRHMKINVWEKQKTFDKKVCLGEVVIKLESLDLSRHTVGWYQLFNPGATEMSSDEALSHW